VHKAVTEFSETLHAVNITLKAKADYVTESVMARNKDIMLSDWIKNYIRLGFIFSCGFVF
jgi:hypothetical protein